LEKITRDELFAMFDKSVQDKLNALLAKQGVDGLVVFENEIFVSSDFGARTAVAVGSGCTYKTIAECEGGYLNEPPSQRQYPFAYYRCDQRAKANGQVFQTVTADEITATTNTKGNACETPRRFNRRTPRVRAVGKRRNDARQSHANPNERNARGRGNSSPAIEGSER
jgi:hypothetical protein